MDLKFIWIKEHRAIKDLNFNFCHDGEHQFHYDGKKIEIFENKKSPIVFSEKITGLTAIAGKNGSGKSSFCEAVINATATLQENSFSIDHLFNGIVVFNKSIYANNDLIIDNEIEFKHLGYTFIRYENSPLEKELERRREDEFLGRLGFIYFSNNFDFKSYIEGNNVTNISTSFRMYKDHYYNSFCLKSEIDTHGKKKGDCQSQINIFHSQEHYRILKFILQNPDFTDFAKDNMPVSVFSSYSGNNKFLNFNYSNDELSEYLEGIEIEIFDSIFMFYPDKQEYIEVDQDKFKTLIHKLYKLNFLIFFKEQNAFSIDEAREFIYSDIIPDFFSNKKLKVLLQTHRSLLEKANFDSHFSVNDFSSINSEFKDWRFNPISRFYIDFTDANRLLLKNIINLELEILSEKGEIAKRFTNFSLFSYLSSGEFALLSFYARIFEVIEGYKLGIYNKTGLLIFLDEPESGYHPNWSRDFIKRLTSFLENDFNSFNVQLIITTHSPYILSDLPKENIRLFNRENDVPPKIVESKSNTFGSNIYDLMHDSFFMSEGFIGSFAQEKIDEVFSELSNKIENTKHKLKIDKSYIKSIISIVGEPLIQRQLSSLYDRVFNEDLEVEIIDRQMETLKKLKERKLKGKE